MMRLIAKCLALVFLLVAGAVTLAAQQAQPAAAQRPAQAPAAKSSSGQNLHITAARHTTSHHARKAAARKRAKRPEYHPAYSENAVEVINGDTTKKVLFRDGQNGATAKTMPAALKNAPGPMKVEVMNGAYSDTQYLYNNGEDQRIEASLNRPVVVGVESSDTRFAGGNKHPVVTRVTTSGAGDAKSTSSGGESVTRRVAPRQRRPAYQPEQ